MMLSRAPIEYSKERSQELAQHNRDRRRYEIAKAIAAAIISRQPSEVHERPVTVARDAVDFADVLLGVLETDAREAGDE